MISLLSPLLLAHGAWMSVRDRAPHLLPQKLGLQTPWRSDHPIWLHMASVGEVNAAQPLVTALRTRHPALPLLATTFTATGAEAARARLSTNIEHAYLPFDFGYATRRFLASAKPRCALIMETEIWPRLFYECHRFNIPLVIINGRLSQRTLKRPAWMLNILHDALQNVAMVLARSPTDAEGFRALGVPEERIQIIDSIKFAATPKEIHPIPLGRPYVVAASTHDDEEMRITTAWLASKLAHSHLLVIVPRHPQRSDSIQKQLRTLGAQVARRSAHEDVDNNTAIYLADTFGELQNFMAGAELVFMGGTLIPRGGQNVIEAARLERVAIFGPHMENFAEERALLLGCEGALEVESADRMVMSAAALIADPSRRAAMGANAKRAIEAKGDIVARYLDALEPWLKAAP
ncbi:MAG: 3-deoxy-D-manno-octulosonic acid transferase [Chromatiales bacterium]|jgi:3-deoxy-D-manno-octulosonic-acid transferase|nr:3-deoxy-D-manno-octulosonic acid transferase [Chromatiales bacterium]